MPQGFISGISGSSDAASRFGLDTKAIVDKLVAIEKRPIDTSRKKQSELNEKLNAYAILRAGLLTFKSALTPLRSLDTFQPRSVSSSDPKILTASATSTAVLGTSTVNQVVQLAQSHKLQSAAFTAGTDSVGTGTLRIQIGDGKSTSIFIDPSRQSLLDVRDKINDARAGVTASLLKRNETDYHLMVQANETGEANKMTLEVTDSDGDDQDGVGLSQLRYIFGEAENGLTEMQSAQDAIFEVDSVEFSRPSNTVSDAVPGVTLTLLKPTDPNADITVNVFSNSAAAKGPIEAFVSTYNNLVRDLNRTQLFDTQTRQKGPLLGDTVVRRLTERLHTLVTGRVPDVQGDYTSIVHFGITSEKDGTLKINSATLESALMQDPVAVGRVFSSVERAADLPTTTALSGVANGMFSYVSDLVLTNTGDVAIHEKGLKDTVTRIDGQISTIQKRVDAFEKKTRDRFAKLEVALERLGGVESGLLSQISQLGNLLGTVQNRRRGGR